MYLKFRVGPKILCKMYLNKIKLRWVITNSGTRDMADIGWVP